MICDFPIALFSCVDHIATLPDQGKEHVSYSSKVNLSLHQKHILSNSTVSIDKSDGVFSYTSKVSFKIIKWDPISHNIVRLLHRCHHRCHSLHVPVCVL